MKKTLAFCIALALSVLSCVVPASAEGAMQLAVEQKTASAGDTVEISVYVKNNPGFTYVKLGLEYDGSALSLTSVRNGELIESLTEGRYYVWSAANDQKGDGVLVTFSFAVNENAADGNYAVSVRCYECSDEQEQDVAVSVGAGGVTVKAASSLKLGDLNGDGKITAIDYAMVKRYVLKGTGLDDAQKLAADINGDRRINSIDYAFVKKHVLGTYTIEW